MSLKYAEQRIMEALKLSGGNQAKARLQVIAWADEDPALLKALTKHHLTGIVAYNVERVASGRSSKPKAPAPKPQRAEAKQDDEFGMQLLKAVASSSSAVFGLEAYSSPRKKGQASQQHIDAIKKMASKSTIPPKK